MFPTPKFVIGQRVVAARTKLVPIPVTCPDCLNTGKWAVQTPAGETFDIDCGTCMYERVIPLSQYMPYVETLTVGSVRVDTYDRENPVSYMMEETGVGSGTIHYERQLFVTEDQAMTRALHLATEQNLKMQQDSERRRTEAKKRPRRKPKQAK